MSSAPDFRETVASLLHERLLDAAAAITTESGWAAVTMAKIADVVGVSRQTVYNELGSKPQIAQALVDRELARFLDIVRERMTAQTELGPALQAACQGALETSAANPLVRAIFESAHTGGSDLLPLLTTDSAELIANATAFIGTVIAEQGWAIPVSPERLAVVVENLVRLTLSHMMQPTGTPERTATDIGWLLAGALGSQCGAG
jgi:AcrR family transcriptional regulator